MSETEDLPRAAAVTKPEVLREVLLHLAPFHTGEHPIVGETVIAKDLTIDSTAIMDMVMELEDRFDVSIPMSVIAEIHTANQLAEAIIGLKNRS